MLLDQIASPAHLKALPADQLARLASEIREFLAESPSLTGGMAYEALNNIGASKPNLLIVLNDNGRSYQATVGGIASHLNHLRLSPGYHAFKGNVEEKLRRLPAGGGLAALLRRVKNSA